MTAVCWPASAIQERHGILAGVVLTLDAAAYAMVVKLADGTEHIFHVVKRTAIHEAQETTAGAEKSTKVTVYYTEEAGQKVAYFFQRTI